MRPPRMIRSIATRRGWLAGCAAALAVSLVAGCATPPQAPDEARRALAPTGTLRVAVYLGSPTSLVQTPGSAEQRGLSVEIGRELAVRLGVPVAIVIYPRVAEVVAALRRGEADFTITNATAERAREIDFTAPVLSLELGVLVRRGVPLADAQAMDQAGLRIGVSQGSSSHRVLGGQLRQAVLVPQATLEAAAQALNAGQIDAFATNKAILFELADGVPGSTVLASRWGLEHVAIATGQGREAGLAYLRQFAGSVRAGGQVAAAAKRAGLRGLAPPEAK
jgi:polar amino acid transport system substrate-binding protein